MDLRAFLDLLEERGMVRHVKRPVSPTFDLARSLARAGAGARMFDAVAGFPGWRIASGYVAQREHFALALGCEVSEINERLAEALAHPEPPEESDHAYCQEVIALETDLTKLPIPRYHPLDGGPYITAGVSVIHDPTYGRNLSFHRMMVRDETHLVARIVEGRGTHTAWRGVPEGISLAVCIGLPPHILLAAALSPAKGVDELAVAQALAPAPTVPALTQPLDIPAQAELVLEGVLTHEISREGPFPDLTGTLDGQRLQPVFRVTAITHRRNPIFHALFPSGPEHKNLMGIPREPTILAEVRKVVRCTGVYITPGGCSWLHAVVQIEKQGPDDGRLAIEAAFRGHKSLKHVVVVDQDVDLYNPAEVEWAIATRFQADRDLYLYRDQPSSSLDPSARQQAGKKARTAKMGLDATIPWGANREGYTRLSWA